MDIHSLLLLLSDGQYHSGSELGLKLGVSRTAVWKSLKQLANFNLKTDAVKGRGYRLKGGLELLSSEAINQRLSPKSLPLINLNILLSTGSTNKYLMESSVSSSKPYEVCAAEIQTEGRGRRGKSWHSPFGKNIYLSIAFDLPGGTEALSGLSLVVGLAVIRSLRSQGVENAMLKWPNDIWVDSKKMAGILVELKGEATTGWQVVAGIGLNVGMTREEGAQIDQKWASVNEYVPCSRNKMMAVLLENLVNIFEEFKQSGFSAFLQEWQQYDLLRGMEVDVQNSPIKGVAIGIDVSGALQINMGNELLLVNAGEVSVRPYEA